MSTEERVFKVTFYRKIYPTDLIDQFITAPSIENSIQQVREQHGDEIHIISAMDLTDC